MLSRSRIWKRLPRNCLWTFEGLKGQNTLRSGWLTMGYPLGRAVGYASRQALRPRFVHPKFRGRVLDQLNTLPRHEIPREAMHDSSMVATWHGQAAKPMDDGRAAWAYNSNGTVRKVRTPLQQDKENRERSVQVHWDCRLHQRAKPEAHL